MSSEKNTPITEFNPNALKQIGKYLEFYNWDKTPVRQEVTFHNFYDLSSNISALLQAIEFIGYNGKETDLATCATLASIAGKMLPNKEMEFLDELLIKESSTKDQFLKIENL
jgi:hypothetical protein